MKRKNPEPNIGSVERKMARQESVIPTVAKREFKKAFESAIESGAQVLVAREGQLVRVSKGSEDVVVRSLDGTFGNIRRGTRLDIKKRK
jgi:hypothetical protein